MKDETLDGYKSITDMRSQLKDIKRQLAQQVQMLKDKLEGLEHLLQTQEEELSQLKALFWASIVAMMLGMLAMSERDRIS
jgi:predicted nuclease with TOPRIM domain